MSDLNWSVFSSDLLFCCTCSPVLLLQVVPIVVNPLVRPALDFALPVSHVSRIEAHSARRKAHRWCSGWHSEQQEEHDSKSKNNPNESFQTEFAPQVVLHCWTETYAGCLAVAGDLKLLCMQPVGALVLRDDCYYSKRYTGHIRHGTAISTAQTTESPWPHIQSPPQPFKSLSHAPPL